ncbi:hypothetical protein ASG31_05245 [Chryseobacterium sp. Leaf404]|uniref:hypothetical protein n=1 Tax=unclassified Chryseobacterium TaxID=2593645 RepID=UPI0006F967BE|nr:MULTISPECIES: hypothetical protein [unclassified Chryseobacterium]KQT18140.1 hypothetical protein ASG31_05245 [Chryseobacterium sp. Leaf404]
MFNNTIEKIDFLRFFLGNSNGKSAELIIDKGFVYISEYFGYFKEILQNPDKKISENSEKQLISTFEEIGIHGWKENYINDEIFEGKEWELEMKINDEQKHYYFFGYEEYPLQTGDSTSLNYSAEFRKLLQTLNSVCKSKCFA